ncbi:hypothetical protein L1887_55313 [Cichorium endivia]|nr:hypothetical protein L1887_55313 [Cichorium endivia]
MQRSTASHQTEPPIGSHKRKADDELAGVQGREVARALTVMLFRTYLRPSSVHQYVSPRDKEIKYEAKRRRELRGHPPRLRDLQRIREEVRVQIAEEREADWDFAPLPASALGPDGLAAADHRETRRGLVRKKAECDRARQRRVQVEALQIVEQLKDKKAKDKAKDRNGLNGVHSAAGTAEGFDPADDYEIDPSVWLRVHYDRFDVHVRDEIMVDAVREKYNKHRRRGVSASSSMRATRRCGARCATCAAHPSRSPRWRTSCPRSCSLQKGFDRRSFWQGQVGAAYQAGVPRRVLRHLFARRRRLGKSKTSRLMAPASDSTTKTAGGQQGGVVAHGRICQCGGAHASRSAAQRESCEDQSEEERRDAQTAAAAAQGREERCQAGYRGFAVRVGTRELVEAADGASDAHGCRDEDRDGCVRHARSRSRHLCVGRLGRNFTAPTFLCKDA